MAHASRPTDAGSTDGADDAPLAQPPKMSDVLADRLRARILGQNLQPGDSLSSESELISTYAVARGTVREALRLLEADGLIKIRRGRQGGIWVRQPDLSTISRSSAVWLAMRGATMREFLEFRLLIEPAAAAAACHRATNDERDWLRSLVAEGATPDLGHSVELHEAIAICSGNSFLRMATAAMRQEMEWHATGEHFDNDQLAGSNRAHRAIVAAIDAGDTDRAHHAMTRHLQDLETALKKRGRLDEAVMPAYRWLDRS